MSDFNSGKYTIKIPRFDSWAPEEWTVFVNLVLKALVGHSDASCPSCTVSIFTTVMATMTMHIFPLNVQQDPIKYLCKYLRKPMDIKVHTFITRLVQLNNYLPYFPPNCMELIVKAISDDKVEGILYRKMLKLWRKNMNKQGYNWLKGTSQECLVSSKRK